MMEHKISRMDRQLMLQNMEGQEKWDLVVIGGGATGLGAALDAASRGYKTLLIEKYDFAKGTSSRSTKLVHGGVRYLAQGNIKLVLHALQERGRLLKNAPHITHAQAFVLPVYSFLQKCYYAIGLSVYDILSGQLSLGKTSLLSRKKTLEALPAINPKKLSGAILYYDGQFDDARLAIDIAAKAIASGAVALNYMAATGFEKENGKITGVMLKDTITHANYTVKTAAVINATGVFTDEVLRMDNPNQPERVAPSQGIHLVIDKKYFPGNNALMIPKTDDGRVLFAVPWNEKVILGTTDTAVNHIDAEPKPLAEEIDFILHHFNKYCTTAIKPEEVLSVYVGLRPLVKPGKHITTAQTTRDHTILVSETNLITVVGGKWTTYRKMAEDVVNHACTIGKLEKKSCITATLSLGEIEPSLLRDHPLFKYGKHAKEILQLMQEMPDGKEKIHPNYSYTKAEITWIIRNEMPQTVEDILSRRIRLLILDARAAIECSVMVAALLKAELQKDNQWMQEQIDNFKFLAKQYLLS